MFEGSLLGIMMDHLSEGLYILDHNGNYVFANDTYLSMLGVTLDELLQVSAHNLKDKGNYDTCISDLVFKSKKNAAVFSNIYVNCDGVLKRIRHLVRATPLLDEDGNIKYMMALCNAVDDLNDCYYEATIRSMASQNITFANQTIENAEFKTELIAESPAMLQALSDARKIARVDSTVLISGASGTGKELMAEYIHRHSPREKACMVVVNCAALPENLLESSLYGYEGGSFTGALSSGKIGLIEAANGGTLFLDEINSLPLALQGKLLRTLETKKVQRVGSVDEHCVDFRLIAATNSDLNAMVHSGLFREDLYYRLNIVPVHLPSLKDRKEDILPLIKHFCNHYGDKYQKDLVFSDAALQQLLQYHWPGNVRELRNFIERAMVLTSSEYVQENDIMNILDIKQLPVSDHLPSTSTIRSNADIYETMLQNHISLQDYIETCEKGYLTYALTKYDSSYKAAKALQTTQSLIMRRKKAYQL